MDWLLEMLVNAIVSAFRDRAPRTTPVPARPTARPSPPATKPAPPRRSPAPPQARRGGSRPATKRIAASPLSPAPPPTPDPRFVVTMPAPPPAPQSAANPLSSVAIRRLIHSRPAAMRSIVILSEILQPPLGLR
jgi:DNA-directed RNA polymerase specialized sigma24 family protein